jgi:CelD/BcsL family acetyltransferase involved in cellulose biosynthesis/SAM-dependent methyltransferase
MAVSAEIPATADVEFEVGTLRSLEDLEALGDAWNQLTARVRHVQLEPMQTHAWSLVAARTLHAGDQLNVLVVRRGSQLAAVAPLVEVWRRGGRWLEFIGSDRLYEPMRLLADSDAARVALCRAIVRQRRPLLLQRLDPGEWLEEFRTQAPGRAVMLVANGGSCLRVELTGSFEDFSRRLSTERAATLRRKRRQLERVGEVRFETLQPTPAEVPAVLRAAFEVESRSWKGAGGSAVLSQPEMFEFFSGVAAHYAASGELLVRRLHVGNEIAAVHVGVVQSNRCYELKIGYDEKWSRQSPGLLLTLDCLRDGFERGHEAHEFLGSAANWQEPFATGERPLRNVALYPLSLAGLFWLAVDIATFAGRRAIRIARGAIASTGRVGESLSSMRRQRIADWRARWFDWRNQVETTSQVAVADLKDIDERTARHAVHYEATSIPKFERALGIVGSRADGFTFVDLGSGKGRVLMLAAQRPFRRVIGVEVSRALHESALVNVAKFAARNRRAAPIECLCADASAYELPAGDLLVFLYNPFDAPLLTIARDRMLAACAGHKRQLCVVYINPLHHALFEQNGRFDCAHRDSSLAVYWLISGLRTT